MPWSRASPLGQQEPLRRSRAGALRALRRLDGGACVVAEARGMARLTPFSLLSLPGSWSGPHRLWARRIPGEPGKFRTLARPGRVWEMTVKPLQLANFVGVQRHPITDILRACARTFLLLQ